MDIMLGIMDNICLKITTICQSIKNVFQWDYTDHSIFSHTFLIFPSRIYNLFCSCFIQSKTGSEKWDYRFNKIHFDIPEHAQRQLDKLQSRIEN